MKLLEILFILLISFLCIHKKKWFCIYLIATLFPFHAFIKYVLQLSNGGEIFSFWKEICICIFALKIFIPKLKKTKIEYLPTIRFSLLLVFYLFIYFIFTSASFHNSLARFRDLFFPLLLFLSLFYTNIEKYHLKKFILLFSISCSILGLIGYLEMFGGLRLPIAMITGKFKGIGSDGTLYYADAMMIMGYNRMTSLLDSPNQLGLLCALCLIVVIKTKDYFDYSKNEKIIINLNTFIIATSLLLTFSRTGYAIFIISMWGILRKQTKKLFNFTAILILFIVIAGIIYPHIFEIISSTLHGKEASSADRFNNFTQGFEQILNNPLGKGLGTMALSDTNNSEFIPESSFLSITLEIGIIGIFLILMHYLLVYHNLIRKDNVLAKFMPSVIIGSVIASFVSLNPYMPIYSYYFWILIGMSYSNELKTTTSYEK